MNDHTQRILKQMINLLEDHLEEKSNLTILVNGLEGCMNAIEEKMPETFQTHWYIHWAELETILAMGTEIVRQKEIFEEINAFKDFLSNYRDMR
jgi:hypothetical protein